MRGRAATESSPSHSEKLEESPSRYLYNELASGAANNYDPRRLGDLASLDVLLPELQLPIEPFELSSPVLGTISPARACARSAKRSRARASCPL